MKANYLFVMTSTFFFIGIFTLLIFLDIDNLEGVYIESLNLFIIVFSCFVTYFSNVSKCWSISFIYLICFILFHCGIVISFFFSMVTDTILFNYINSWYTQDLASYAVHLTSLAIISYALGSFCGYLFFKRKVRLNETVESTQKIIKIQELSKYAIYLLITGFFLLIFTLGGSNSYAAYLTLKGRGEVSFILSWFFVFLGYFFVIYSSSYYYSKEKLLAAYILLWCLISFKLGLRGEVLFPLAVSICLISRTKPLFSKSQAIIFIIILLSSITVVKNSRMDGDFNFDSVNPLNAVAEMGSSLRSVYETVKWHKIQGDDFILGQSYWAPFERQIALFVPGIERKPSIEDERLLNVLIQNRAGPYGYSPVAEAYRNFDQSGVIFLFFLLGCFVAYLDKIPSSFKNNIFIGIILIPLFINIRNNFAPMPIQVGLGAIIMFAIYYYPRIQLLKIGKN